MYLGRVRAKRTIASPILLTLVRTGTATAFRCIPIRVPPMSMPASARMVSTATGSEKAFQAVTANQPPALGWGFTLTTS